MAPPRARPRSARDGRRIWRERIGRIVERYPRIPVDLDDLADMGNTLVDGGIILTTVMRDPKLLPRQVELYRAFVRAVFLGA
jgi:TetR/AcrR family transcriptional repressor of nem operon